MVGDMSRVTLNFDLSKIPFVHFSPGSRPILTPKISHVLVLIWEQLQKPTTTTTTTTPDATVQPLGYHFANYWRGWQTDAAYCFNFPAITRSVTTPVLIAWMDSGAHWSDWQERADQHSMLVSRGRTSGLRCWLSKTWNHLRPEAVTSVAATAAAANEDRCVSLAAN